MKPAVQSLRGAFTIGALATCLILAPFAEAADSLRWHKEQNRVEAQIDGWGLDRLLEELTSVTGWQIYVEPETRHTVSTKFKDRTPGDALRLLLGDLNFALLPQTNGPSKLFVFKTSVRDATQLVRSPGRPARAKPIPDELIVTLKKGGDIDDLARRLGGQVIGRAEGLNTYRLKFDSAEAAEAARLLLQVNHDVEAIDGNYVVVSQPRPEALALSSFPQLNLRPKAVADANRIVVGLIDTAVHQQGTGIDAFLLPGISPLGEAPPPSGELTHGDSMAQTILRGVSAMVDPLEGTRVRILPVDVYGGRPATSTFDVALGVYEAINHGATIINLSLGSDADFGLLRNVIQSGHEQGVLFFAAAGNEPTTYPNYPAAYPEVVAVTAGDRNGQIAGYANRGEFVDVVGPGSGIVTYEGQSHLVSGTSVSTANTTGAAAGMADAMGRKPTEVVGRIVEALAPRQR